MNHREKSICGVSGQGCETSEAPGGTDRPGGFARVFDNRTLKCAAPGRYTARGRYTALGRYTAHQFYGFLAFALVLLLCISSCSSVKNIKLTTACKDALKLNHNINADKLVCNVKDGVAYLSGWVYTEKEKEIAEEVVRGVEGIVDVRNTIQIETGGESNPSVWMP